MKLKVLDIVLYFAVIFLIIFVLGRPIHDFIQTKVSAMSSKAPVSSEECIAQYKAQIIQLRKSIENAQADLESGGQSGYTSAQADLSGAPSSYSDPDCSQ